MFKACLLMHGAGKFGLASLRNLDQLPPTLRQGGQTRQNGVRRAENTFSALNFRSARFRGIWRAEFERGRAKLSGSVPNSNSTRCQKI
jgi:hypothetical protein